jgi:hypothetical protein
MRILLVLLSISAAQADCLKENVTFHVPHGTSLSVASPGLASYHQVFRFGDACIGKKHSRFTVKRIEGQLVTGDYQLVENDIAYYNECPTGTFVMTAEEAEKLCRAEAVTDEDVSPLRRPPFGLVFLFR